MINNDNGFELSYETTMGTFNRHVPHKKNYVKGNHKSIFAKDIAKATTERICLRKKFLQIKTYRYKKLYAKQSNYCVSLFRKSEKCYCEKLNINDTRDNKISDKKTDEYYQWTDRYFEWTDEYYE